MSTIADLARRLSRKIEGGRGIGLSHDDLQLLVTTGAFGAVQTAATKEFKERCQQHAAANQSTNEAITASTVVPIARPSKSSGMTRSESASEALAQARAMTRRGG